MTCGQKTRYFYISGLLSLLKAVYYFVPGSNNL